MTGGKGVKIKRRDVHGVLLLDKPHGITSNAALQSVKRLFQANKLGHTGSLDPLATGMLPLCFGESTKVCGFLLDADKRYWTRIQLGIKTNTGDAEGEIIARAAVPSFTPHDIEQALARFRGPIQQIPPMFSAVKKNGKELYKFAHQGIEVERESRQVFIYDLQMLQANVDSLELSVTCSKGTFIRTLAEDIGEVLGCGAHVIGLRRLSVGQFAAENMVTLDALQRLAEIGFDDLDALLLPTHMALTQWPQVVVSEDTAIILSQGQSVLVPKAPEQGFVRLFKGGTDFFGIGKVLDDGRISAKRLIRA